MPGGLEFDFTMRGGAEGATRTPSRLSLLLLGDYGAAGAGDLATAPIVAVDIDNVDELWERFQPTISVELDGAEMVFSPRDLDDFHPDALIASLPVFDAFRSLRKRLRDPETAEAALQEALNSLPQEPVSSSEPEAPAASAAEESADDLLGRLLGEDRPDVSASSPSTNERSGGVEGLVRAAVAGQIVKDPNPRVETALMHLDDAMAAVLQGILQHEGFRALEARWRALFRLVQTMPAAETVELRVCNVRRSALLEGLPTTTDELQRCGLQGLLVDRHRIAADDQLPGIIGLDDFFDNTPDDLALLATLGTIAASIGACVLSGARASLLGAGDMQALGDPHSWRTDENEAVLWSTLRGAPFARHVGLLTPGLLARLPYGRASDPVATLDFEETSTGEAGAFVWSGPVPAVCACLLERFDREGTRFDMQGSLDIDDLPAFSYRASGETQMRPCTEVLMPESAAVAALEGGVMPLAGFRNQDRARVVRLQSIAEPLAPLAGPWSRSE